MTRDAYDETWVGGWVGVYYGMAVDSHPLASSSAPLPSSPASQAQGSAMAEGGMRGSAILSPSPTHASSSTRSEEAEGKGSREAHKRRAVQKRRGVTGRP